ncbi:E3 ubiquitin-protein ligase MIB2-like [Dreissena polymorpha]|uniref:RING-type E3 ubiquitin transferase n=1 Tax=Dreissena polymorpha TaxID=45954 RepID=A0A9D4ITH8_DREPO|nr:E3 ubiquitin-protein ligase MIB2-like [Dreissena polymorpha]XP_052228767.1 E3 ubiquitin-protein ligase MIB2-like [Dreissena polymorpha]XP_052228768.1 E3 ubiquitin-protein ligase MIB2-like [Dreissena polymorpha]KAH3783603.1 hypothetical protein DPMN_161545 [Dreissena polymorpha]
MDIARVGIRVVRGPDWSKGEEDGGEGHVGTVKDVYANKTVGVFWDNGKFGTYSIGKDSKYELRVYDNTLIGQNHAGIRCGCCKEMDCMGVVWACQECPGIYLCNSCYCGDRHDIRHPCKRISSPTEEGVAVAKRSASYKVRSTGLFLGAKVKRLPINEKQCTQHLMITQKSCEGGTLIYSREDDGGLGTVTEVISNGENEGDRNAVKVTWSNNEMSICRPGEDVFCVEEMPGLSYYRDHIPVLRCEQDDEEEKNTETNFNPAMKNNKMTNKSTGYDDKPSQHENIRIDNNETAAELNIEIKVGDQVRVIDNLELVRASLKEQWSDSMKDVIGKIGIIAQICSDGNLEVAFVGKSWVFTPDCCKVVSETKSTRPCNTGDELDTAPARKTILNNSDRALHHLVGALGGEELATALERLCEQYPSPTDVPPGFLFHAVLNNNAAVSFLTATRCPHLVNAKHDDFTALMLACQKGHADIAKVLLNCNADVNIKNSKGTTALILALVNGHEQTALLLLEAGAEVNYKDTQGRVPIHYASLKSSTAVIKQLVLRNVNVNAQDCDGDTPLNMAVLAGNVAVAAELIHCRKVNLLIKNKQRQTAVLLAAIKNDVVTTEAILQRCPVQKFPAIADETIQAATYHNNMDVVRLLIKMGVDVNRSSEHHLLPLHDACVSGHFEISKLLVQAGADVNKKDVSGVTPIHLCVAPDSPYLKAVEQTEFFKANLKAIQEMNVRNNTTEKLQERTDLACFLVKHGARVDILDGFGNTPLEICKDQQMKDHIIQHFKLHRARGTEGINLYDRLLSRMAVPCVQCKTTLSNMRIVPCGHIVLCLKCIPTLLAKECPRCNTRIEESFCLG